MQEGSAALNDMHNSARLLATVSNLSSIAAKGIVTHGVSHNALTTTKPPRAKVIRAVSNAFTKKDRHAALKSLQAVMSPASGESPAENAALVNEAGEAAPAEDTPLETTVGAASSGATTTGTALQSRVAVRGARPILVPDETATCEQAMFDPNAVQKVAIRVWSQQEGPLGRITCVVLCGSSWHVVTRGVDTVIYWSSSVSDIDLGEVLHEAVYFMCERHDFTYLGDPSTFKYITSHNVVDESDIGTPLAIHSERRASMLDENSRCYRLELRSSRRVWCLECNLTECSHARAWRAPATTDQPRRPAKPLVSDFDDSLGDIGEWVSEQGATYVSSFVPTLYPKARQEPNGHVSLCLSAAKISAGEYATIFKMSSAPIDLSTLYGVLSPVCQCEVVQQYALPVYLMSIAGAAIVNIPVCASCGTLYGKDDATLGRKATIDEVADIFIGSCNALQFAVAISLTDVRNYVHGFIRTGETISMQYTKFKDREAVLDGCPDSAREILAAHLKTAPTNLFRGKMHPSLVSRSRVYC